MTFLLGRQLANKESMMGSSSESRGKLTWVLVDIWPVPGEAHAGKKSIVQASRTAGAGLLLILIIKQLRFHLQILRESLCQSRCKALSLWIYGAYAWHLCLDNGYYFRKVNIFPTTDIITILVDFTPISAHTESRLYPLRGRFCRAPSGSGEIIWLNACSYTNFDVKRAQNLVWDSEWIARMYVQPPVPRCLAIHTFSPWIQTSHNHHVPSTPKFHIFLLILNTQVFPLYNNIIQM